MAAIIVPASGYTLANIDGTLNNMQLNLQICWGGFMFCDFPQNYFHQLKWRFPENNKLFYHIFISQQPEQC
jgi:hypothetical protein